MLGALYLQGSGSAMPVQRFREKKLLGSRASFDAVLFAGSAARSTASSVESRLTSGVPADFKPRLLQQLHRICEVPGRLLPASRIDTQRINVMLRGLSGRRFSRTACAFFAVDGPGTIREEFVGIFGQVVV